jgi:hypothetical protein
MNTSDEIYDRAALLGAWLEGQKMRHAHDDLRDYHERTSTAFCRAFKVDLDYLSPVNDVIPDNDFNFMFRETVRARLALQNPFYFYIQAPRILDELYQLHSEPIQSALEAITCLYDKLLLDLLERIFGITSSDLVSRNDLHRCGFPPEPAPNPIDYI